MDNKKIIFPGALSGQTITLTFHKEEFLEPDSVLLFPFYLGRLLFTHHKDRGWELPGGKRADGEQPLQTAIRELFEETGAEADGIEEIGQYQIEERNAPTSIKTIYIARIKKLHPLAAGFETDEIRLYGDPPQASDIFADDSFSLILKDEVYSTTMRAISNHSYTK